MALGQAGVCALTLAAITLAAGCGAVGPSSVGPISARPTPVVATPTQAAPSNVYGTELWRGDFATGNTSQYALESTGNYSVTVQDAGPGHPTAGRFEVRDGDTPVDTGERAEAKPPDETDVREGDERWYAFSIMFDPSFPEPQRFCIVMQWHPANADGSAAEGDPPVSVQCGPGDVLNLNLNDRTFVPIGRLDRGVWHSYVLHLKFSQNPQLAFYEVRRDGEVVVPRTVPKGPTLVGPRMYTKIGVYRHPSNTATMIVWHDDLVISGP